MCGRFTLISPPEAVRQAFAYTDQPNFPPRANIAPTQPIGIVRLEQGERRFVLVRWGLVPAWAKEPAKLPLLINARAETIAGKPAFRSAFRRRRCLVPADGWYEWQARGPKTPKQPYFIRPRVAAPIAFAGIWDHVTTADGSEMESAAIVTTDASAALASIHDRMPVVIGAEDFTRWLDPASEVEDMQSLLRPVADEAFEAVPVSTRVNSIANEGVDLTEAIAEAKPSPARQGTLL